MIRDHLVMAKESLSHFHYTGCVCSSSRWAAQALTRPLQNRNGHSTAQRIIEIGAGTGPVTTVILEYMKPGDTLVVCEMNPNLMKALKERLANDPNYLKHKNNVEFVTKAIQEYESDELFDSIICALPFLNFDVRTVDEIFTKLLNITTDEAQMTYFEYMGLKRIGQIASLPKRRKRLREFESYFDEVYKPRLQGTDRVWLNVLPIKVYTLNLDSAASVINAEAAHA